MKDSQLKAGKDITVAVCSIMFQAQRTDREKESYIWACGLQCDLLTYICKGGKLIFITIAELEFPKDFLATGQGRLWREIYINKTSATLVAAHYNQPQPSSL